MTELYDRRIDAMKAREQRIDWRRYPWEDREEAARNADRLAAYKRKRTQLTSAGK